MNSKEKYSEVYRTAKELRKNTELLRKKSRLLYFLSYFTAIFPGLLYTTLILLLHLGNIYSSELRQAISLFMFYVVFFILLLLQIRLFLSVRNLFDEVMVKCGKLSDMVDWTAMRKRQIHSEVDPQIQESIDDFFEYSMSTLCPYYGGKAKYKSLRYLSIVEIIVVTIFSLLFTFGIIAI